jgi:protein-disulfide isomerase
MVHLALAPTALGFLIAASMVRGQSQPGLQQQSPQTRCRGTVPSAQRVPNVGDGTVQPNAPMTEAQGAEILRQLRAIRQLLENGGAARFRARQPPGPHDVKMRVEPHWHELGRANAPVTMIEFADLQCPFCRRFQTTTFAEIKKDYVDTGKVRFIARDLPLPMHPYALGAAEAERCAGDQGKFWQFRDAILGDQAPPTLDILVKHASELGLNLKALQACVDSRKYVQEIQADRSSAMAAGIHGTPAFVIGRADGGWINGLAMQGARSFPFFQQMIDRLLNESSSEPTKANPVGIMNPNPGSGSVRNQ